MRLLRRHGAWRAPRARRGAPRCAAVCLAQREGKSGTKLNTSYKTVAFSNWNPVLAPEQEVPAVRGSSLSHVQTMQCTKSAAKQIASIF